MRVGGKKTDVDEVQFTNYRDPAMNRSMNMKPVLMKNIMRLIVASSVVAITVNILVVFG